jgi:hypothetical protein
MITYYRLRVRNDRPDLSSERALHRDKTATTTFGQKEISGHKPQSGLDILTD